MCPKQSRRSKTKRFQHDCRNKFSKKLTKYITCECKCKLDSRKCSSNQNWNNDKSRCECRNFKEHRVWKKRLYFQSCYM